MSIVWLNGTVGSGKSAIGAALADLLPGSKFWTAMTLLVQATCPIPRVGV